MCFLNIVGRMLQLSRGAMLLTASVLLLSSCGAAQTVGGKVVDLALSTIGVKTQEPPPPQIPQTAPPMQNIPSPPPPPPPKILTVRFAAAQDLNAGEDGQGLSTVVRVYKLRDANAFLAAPYASFGANETERLALGSDLIDARELVLSPGQTLELKEKMTAELAFVGVVALFRAPSKQRWRFAFAAAEAQESGIGVGLHACALSATHAPPVGLDVDQAALLASVKCKEDSSTPSHPRT
jgi:type VI secretion system protein VasD